MAEKKEEDLTQSAVHEAINRVLSKMFNDEKSELYLQPYKREILFSKQIQDWQKQNNTEEEPSDDDLKQFICEDLQRRYKEAITAIEKQYPSADDKECDDRKNAIKIKYKDNNKIIKIEPFFGFYPSGPEINIKPKSLRFCEKNDVIYTSTISKIYIQTLNEKKNRVEDLYRIADLFASKSFNNEDKEKLIKQPDLHNVEIEFEEGKICLQSYFNIISGMVKVNTIEFTLNEGKITEIKQSYDNGTKQNPPTTITDENKINDKIKEIFGDKNNTAIQNIINELDDKQITLITNGHPGLLNDEDKKNVPPKKEKLKKEELEESNQKKPENIDLWNSEIKENQYDTGTKNDINGQDMKFEKTEESPMCNCECWNNLKSWCSKFCSSETTMD